VHFLRSVFTEAVGRSGKIRVSTSADFGDADTIVMELDSIMEVGRAQRMGPGKANGLLLSSFLNCLISVGFNSQTLSVIWKSEFLVNPQSLIHGCCSNSM